MDDIFDNDDFKDDLSDEIMEELAEFEENIQKQENTQFSPELENYFQYFGSPSEVMKKILLCPVCHAHLQFNHLIDTKNGLTQETARCPDCSVTLRQKYFKLQ